VTTLIVDFSGDPLLCTNLYVYVDEKSLVEAIEREEKIMSYKNIINNNNKHTGERMVIYAGMMFEIFFPLPLCIFSLSTNRMFRNSLKNHTI
jgi:hypothetical protein